MNHPSYCLISCLLGSKSSTDLETILDLQAIRKNMNRHKHQNVISSDLDISKKGIDFPQNLWGHEECSIGRVFFDARQSLKHQINFKQIFFRKLFS